MSLLQAVLWNIVAVAVTLPFAVRAERRKRVMRFYEQCCLLDESMRERGFVPTSFTATRAEWTDRDGRTASATRGDVRYTRRTGWPG